MRSIRLWDMSRRAATRACYFWASQHEHGAYEIAVESPAFCATMEQNCEHYDSQNDELHGIGNKRNYDCAYGAR